MFEKISKEKFKKIILFKYTFQLILVHFIYGTIGSIIIFVEEWIRLGWEGAIQSFFVEFQPICSDMQLVFFVDLQIFYP